MLDYATTVNVIAGVNRQAWSSEECAHGTFPEVADDQTRMTAVESLVINVGEIYAEHGDDINVMASAVEHALIYAFAIGLALGRAEASEEIADFIVPDTPEGA